jgi:hypothetical protein
VNTFPQRLRLRHSLSYRQRHRLRGKLLNDMVGTLILVPTWVNCSANPRLEPSENVR